MVVVSTEIENDGAQGGFSSNSLTFLVLPIHVAAPRRLPRRRPSCHDLYCMGSNTYSGDTQAVLDAIRRIVHALRESSRWAERQVGLSGAQLFVLHTLAGIAAASVNELAARTHTHQSSVSIVVTRLVDQGLVRRTRSGSDRRRVGLSRSPRGGAPRHACPMRPRNGSSEASNSSPPAAAALWPRRSGEVANTLRRGRR